MRSISTIAMGLLLITPLAFVSANGSSSDVVSDVSWEGPLIAIIIIVVAVMVAKKIKK